MIMTAQTINIIIFVSLAFVLLILLLGILSMFRKEDYRNKWSNKLMRARVLFQFIAIVLIVLFSLYVGPFK